MHSQLGLKHLYRNSAIALVTAIMAVTLAGCDGWRPRSVDDAMESDTDVGRALAVAKPGEVLVIGGGTITSVTPTSSEFKATETAEVFSIATKTFARTGSMTTGRGAIQAVAFTSGPLKQQVLVPGGVSGDGSFSMGDFVLNTTPQKSSEIFKGSRFSNAGTMNGQRFFYTATLLKNGKVLIAGGFKGTTPLRTAELYDPATKTYASVSMRNARAAHSATLLANGQVLLAGGVTDTHGTTTNTAELYNPTTNKFSAVPATFSLGLAGHAAVLMSGCGCSLDGKVLFIGGFRGAGTTSSPATEVTINDVTIYDPAAKTFTAGNSMKEARAFHTATLINGKVHVIGGSNGVIQFGNGALLEFAGSEILKSAEVFTASAGSWACVGGVSGSNCMDAMHVRRGAHTATYFPDRCAGGKGAGHGRKSGPDDRALQSGDRQVYRLRSAQSIAGIPCGYPAAVK